MAERSEAQTIGPRRLEGQACGNRLGRGRGRGGKRRGSHGGQVLRERGQGEEHREKAGERKSQAEHKMRREILLKIRNKLFWDRTMLKVQAPGRNWKTIKR